jgi:uncharacterized protein
MREVDLGEGAVALRLERGEEVASALLAWAKRKDVSGASISAIGAVENVELGFFDRDAKRYERLRIAEVSELLSLQGTLGRLGDDAILHAHAVLGSRDFAVRGGHFFRGDVAVTVEVVVQRTTNALRRAPDAATGLNFIQS